MALLLRAALARTGGHLVYALDDAYIHMAVARNLADHGVWGVTRYGFTSSVSSLLWPLLLALIDRAVGVHESTPLVLNLVFAGAAVLIADRLLRGLSAGARAAALVSVVLLTPLPTLILAGMEHPLHIAAVLWLLDRVRAVEEAPASASALACLGAAAAVATAARYESLFLVAPLAIGFGASRRWRALVVSSVSAALPVVVFAAVSMAQGWPPLPNSLLLKRATFEGGGLAGLADRLGGHLLRTLVEAPHLLVLLAAVLLMSAFLPGRRVLRVWDVMFATAALLHAQLAAVGWLFRYEAYLVAIGIVLVASHLSKGVPAEAWLGSRALSARPALVLAALVAASPLFTRAVAALVEAPAAVRNIYEQQYQMGLFLRELPAGATVMANDIGAIAWLADVRLVDLFGLATQETARARRAGRVDRALLSRLAEESPPAAVVVYRSWFADAIPPEWIEAGTWKVAEKVVVADRTVSFLATTPEQAARLARALSLFQPRLPPTVSARVADTASP